MLVGMKVWYGGKDFSIDSYHYSYVVYESSFAYYFSSEIDLFSNTFFAKYLELTFHRRSLYFF